MPRKKRDGEHIAVYAELPAEIVHYLEQQAAENSRTKTAELLLVLAEWKKANERKKGKK